MEKWTGETKKLKVVVVVVVVTLVVSFSSLSTRLAHAARLGFFLQQRAI